MMGTSQQVWYDISQIIDVEDAVTLLKRYEPQAAILAVGVVAERIWAFRPRGRTSKFPG